MNAPPPVLLALASVLLGACTRGEVAPPWPGLVDAGPTPDARAAACRSGDTLACGVAIGECAAGVQTCEGGEWSGCVGAIAPDDEVCNQLDDDCDALTDEACGCLDGQSRPCGSTVGACAVGAELCVAGSWTECSAPEPDDERCDGLDNDCNGVVDEGCPCVTGATLVCGTSIGACVTGTQTCRDGIWPFYCDGGVSPFTATGPRADGCDGMDHDCDGTPDDGCACEPGTMQRCGLDLGRCVQGVQVCVGGRLGVCDGTIGPAPETCDGEDEDCDGVVDEDCPRGAP